MKFLILLLITFSAFANEVIVVNNQKLVLIEKKTAKAVDKILKLDEPNELKLEKLKLAFKKEKNFCTDAVAVYNVDRARCEKILSRNYLYEDLLADVPDYHDEQDLREILSKYIAILILM